jgi:hypothetical protein
MAAAARHAVLDAGGRTAFAGDAVGGEAVVEAPVGPVAGDDAGDEAAVAVHRGGRHQGEALVVTQEATQALAAQLRDAVFGVHVVECVRPTVEW